MYVYIYIYIYLENEYKIGNSEIYILLSIKKSIREDGVTRFEDTVCFQ
jgi:hypothetical protein